MNARRLRRLISLRSRLEREQEERLQVAARNRDGRASVVSERDAHKVTLLGSPSPRDTQAFDLESAALYLHRVDRQRSASRAALQHSLVVLAQERATLLARRRDRRALDVLLDRDSARRRALAVRAERERVDEHVAHAAAVNPNVRKPSTQRRGAS